MKIDEADLNKVLDVLDKNNRGKFYVMDYTDNMVSLKNFIPSHFVSEDDGGSGKK